MQGLVSAVPISSAVIITPADVDAIAAKFCAVFLFMQLDWSPLLKRPFIPGAASCTLGSKQTSDD